VHAGRDCFLDEQVLELAVAELHHLVVLLKVWKEGGGAGVSDTAGAMRSCWYYWRFAGGNGDAQAEAEAAAAAAAANSQRPATSGQRPAASGKRPATSGSKQQAASGSIGGHALKVSPKLQCLYSSTEPSSHARPTISTKELPREGGRGGRGQSVRQSCLVGGERGAV